MALQGASETASQLAIVIPALNERSNLELLLPVIREMVDKLGVRAEIVVVDGGSHDGTREEAEQRGARVVQQVERGYGGALLAGFAAATAPYIVTMDADLSHRPVFLEDLWQRREDAELVIASRYIPGGASEVGWFRGLLSRILNRVYRRILSLPFHDLSSGFRMYSRLILDGLTLRARDFDALEEILIRVHAGGWRILEIPFQYRVRGAGASHVRFARFAWAFLKTLYRMWQFRNSVEAADYDYRAFDSPVWLQRYWQRTRHRIVLGYLEDRTGILDVGCGTSRIIVDLPAAVGMDILENKLRWLRPRHQVLANGRCESLPFRDESFKTVISSEVIEHVPDVPEIWKEMWRVLKPGGIAIVGTPDYGRWLWWVIEWIYDKVHPDAYAHEHITHFTRASLLAKLRDAGFDVLAYKYVGFCELIVQAKKPHDAG